MATSTPQRRSLGRPRRSLGLTSVKTPSSPNLASAITPSQKRPPLPPSQLSARRPSSGINRTVSLPQQPPANDPPTVPNGDGHFPVIETGLSPFAMHPSRPANSRTATDDKNANQNLEVGDVVDVPGSMHGTIKFIGEVRGKKGHFAGVELSKEFAAKGKNDGDVDGYVPSHRHVVDVAANAKRSIRYFTTSIRGAGIFLPSNKAYKRLSRSLSSDSMPPTPDTPSLRSSYIGARGKEPKVYTPTSSSKAKLSQSVGPGRARSPEFKPKSRPSLPRPESPLRKAQNPVLTPSGRPSVGVPNLSKSLIGGPRHVPSPTPAKFGSSVRGGSAGDPGKKVANLHKPMPRTPNNARSQSRSNSRLGPEAMFDEDSDNTPIGVAKGIPTQGVQRKTQSEPNQESEIQRLRQMLEIRDKQLEKQTLDLEEMQNSITELQTLTPKHNSAGTTGSRGSEIEELDAVALRFMLREKNEKIAALTSQFDDHRADFRNTIDSLERTSDETNRIYEHKLDELKQVIEDMRDSQEVQDMQNRGNDVETVAQQLKQLEELVSELEEGLEDARRGEAEARGEVEFLRGEVERTRSELRREREKAAAALKGAGASMDGTYNSGGLSKEVEQRDDEIRGLKAIIHSLSRDAVPEMGSPKAGSRRVSKRHSNQTNGHVDSQSIEERQAREKLEREIKELEGLVDRKTYREEELEHEIERLRKTTSHVSSSSNGYSEQTFVPNDSQRSNLSRSSSQDWRGSVKRQVPHLESMPESDDHSTTMTDSSSLYCEMCETFGHEIFTCPNINGEQPRHDEQRLASPEQKDRNNIHKGLKGLSVSSPHTNDYSPPLSPARSPTRSPTTTPKAKIPNPMDQGPVAGKASGAIDMGKWCAFCERDGHESVDCPFEDMY